VVPTSERRTMNFRLAFSSLFLGILTAFVVWSFQWVLDSRREAAFDLPGDVTVLTMYGGRRIIVTADAALAQEQLKTYLRDRSLALIISSYGDGRPEMLVYDPHGLVAWFPRATAEDCRSGMTGVYLIEGTYSERRWSEAAATPLLSKGVGVEGIISAPVRAGLLLGGLQYAKRIGHERLPPGHYAINTIDQAHVRHILDLLGRMGLARMRAQGVPLPTVGNVVLNPLFFFTLLLLVSGHACTFLYWSFYLRGRASEFRIRVRHGARPLVLVRENLMGGLPGLVVGALLGVTFSGLLVAAIAGVPLTQGNLQTLASAAVVTAISVLATWLAALHVVIRSEYEVHLVG